MRYKKLLLASVVVLFSVGCFFSCTKNNVYKAVVTVSRLNSENVKIPVPECKLVFGEDNYVAEVKRIGYTDMNGKYEGEWDREVTLPIYVTRTIGDTVYSGFSMIRLTQENVAMCEILIKPE